MSLFVMTKCPPVSSNRLFFQRKCLVIKSKTGIHRAVNRAIGCAIGNSSRRPHRSGINLPMILPPVVLKSLKSGVFVPCPGLFWTHEVKLAAQLTSESISKYFISNSLHSENLLNAQNPICWGFGRTRYKIMRFSVDCKS
jgi:hypothetical protein